MDSGPLLAGGDGPGGAPPESGAGSAEVGMGGAGAGPIGGGADGCDLDAPFREPVPLDSINSEYSEQQARLSQDGKYVYFASDRAAQATGVEDLDEMDVYRAARVGESFAFTDVERVDSLSQTSETNAKGDFSGIETLGGLTLYFDTYRSSRQIWRATRLLLDDEWGSLIPVNPLNSGKEEFEPSVDPLSRRIFFTTGRNGPAARFDIYWAPIEDGVVKTPGAVAGVKSAEAERAPVISDDLSRLYYAAQRSQFADSGYDIWVSRSNGDETFGAAARLGSLSSGGNDYPTWISSDGCYLFLSSERVGGRGLYDVYVAERQR